LFDDNVRFNLAENQVQYTLKTVDILQTDKAKQIFEKGIKNNWSLDKILSELQIPKEQKQLFEEIWLNVLNKGRVGMPTTRELLDEAIVDFAANYSYTIEINTAKGSKERFRDNEGSPIFEDGEYFHNQVWNEGVLEPYSEEFNKEVEKRLNNANSQPTQYYSNLTVPGGTNYTENEISTPLITPSIKGHAQFSTDNGIGWFRSDDKNPFTGFLEDLVASGTIKKVPC
jgi:hypothetical protein